MDDQITTPAISRRAFLKIGLAGTLLLIGGCERDGGSSQAISVAIPVSTLDPGAISKYVMGLVRLPTMPRTEAQIDTRVSGKIDYYEIAARQFQQRILPPELPLTTVWGYCSLLNPQPAYDDAGQPNPPNRAGIPATLSYPSFTIEATTGNPVRVNWINQLREEPDDPASAFLPHLLTVDPTISWANPTASGDPNRYGVGPIDSAPSFLSSGGIAYTPEPYDGPVPLVAHVDGALNVGDESNGYAAAWYLPLAGNIPAGYDLEGGWYKTFRRKYYEKFTAIWAPGTATFHYPNAQRATTLWYHDQALGLARLSLYAGLAGFYLLHDGSGDKVRTAGTTEVAILPTDAYEIPVMIQDRSFDSSGQLFFPSSRSFFDGFDGPAIPGSDISPFHNPAFFANTMVVNGRTWPKLQVEPRRYRLRLLNGCNSRFLALKLVEQTDFEALPAGEAATSVPAAPAAVPVWQIGNESGFLRQPVDMNSPTSNPLPGTMLIGMGERADVIIDFSGQEGKRFYLTNEGPDAPFGGGMPGVDFLIADRDTTRQVLMIEVSLPLEGADLSTPPDLLEMPALEPLPEPDSIRQVALITADSGVLPGVGPRATFCGVVEGDVASIQRWADPISENPQLGAVEDWEIYNFSAEAYPIHLHEVAFELIERRTFTAKKVTSGDGVALAVESIADSASDPAAWEDGLKNTVISYPGQITTIRVRFDLPGRYAWHSHGADHQDNEMMRPYDVGPLNARSQMRTGRIRVSHRESNQAIFSYVYVGDALVSEQLIAPASGIDTIKGTKLSISAANPGAPEGSAVTEVDRGGGYSVSTPPTTDNSSMIAGSEQLSFALTPDANGRGAEKTYMIDFTCAFRMTEVGGRASVLVEAFNGETSVGGQQTLDVVTMDGSLFTASYSFAFGALATKQPFDRIVFSSQPDKTYSIVNPIEIRTLTANFNDLVIAAPGQEGDGQQNFQIFICDF